MGLNLVVLLHLFFLSKKGISSTDGFIPEWIAEGKTTQSKLIFTLIAIVSCSFDYWKRSQGFLSACEVALIHLQILDEFVVFVPLNSY